MGVDHGGRGGQVPQNLEKGDANANWARESKRRPRLAVWNVQETEMKF